MQDRTKYWMNEANNLISCASGDFGRNQLITKAYASIYLEDPATFKWAGMAAFASAMVGWGIATGKGVDILADLAGRGKIRSHNRINTTDLDNLLSLGNFAVYNDLFWQHLMFKNDGHEALQQALAPFVEKDAALRKVSEGWIMIAEGKATSNEELIWQGNEMLLRYEQENTLQVYYMQYSSLADKLSWFMVSPLPKQIGYFAAAYPGQSIANFELRWLWITKYLLPQWRSLDMQSRIANLTMDGVDTLRSLFGYAIVPRALICLGQ